MPKSRYASYNRDGEYDFPSSDEDSPSPTTLARQLRLQEEEEKTRQFFKRESEEREEERRRQVLQAQWDRYEKDCIAHLLTNARSSDALKLQKLLDSSSKASGLKKKKKTKKGGNKKKSKKNHTTHKKRHTKYRKYSRKRKSKK